MKQTISVCFLWVTRDVRWHLLSRNHTFRPVIWGSSKCSNCRMPLHLFSEAGIRLKQTFVPFSDWDRYIHLMKQASDWNRHLFHFQTAFDVFGIHRGTWRGGYLWPLPGEEVSGEPDVSQPTAGQHLSTKEKEKEGQETQRGIVMQCCWFQCLHIILCNCILVVNIHVCVPSKWPQQNVFFPLPPTCPTPPPPPPESYFVFLCVYVSSYYQNGHQIKTFGSIYQ